jgi:hypothetical protein
VPCLSVRIYGDSSDSSTGTYPTTTTTKVEIPIVSPQPLSTRQSNYDKIETVPIAVQDVRSAMKSSLKETFGLVKIYSLNISIITELVIIIIAAVIIFLKFTEISNSN